MPADALAQGHVVRGSDGRGHIKHLVAATGKSQTLRVRALAAPHAAEHQNEIAGGARRVVRAGPQGPRIIVERRGQGFRIA